MKNESNTTLAMDASDGMFAYHLIGVMTAAHNHQMLTPDPEVEARDYLRIYHADILKAAEAKEENNNNPLTSPSN